MVLASVDPPAAQLAMNATWDLPFRWVSDPDGSRLGRPLDAWNAEERGGLLMPLVLLVAPDGRELVRHRSRDFADRADDSDVLEALRELALPEAEPPAPWAPADVAPQPSERAFRPSAFGPYFRGARFTALALAGRMRDPADADDARETARMAASFLAAHKERQGRS